MLKPASVAALALVAAVWGVACRSHPPPPTHRYQMQGTIVAVNRGTRNLVVRHGDIPGYMPAMTMPYAAGRGENLTFLENGDEIRADVLVTIEGAAHLEHITIVKRPPGTPPRP